MLLRGSGSGSISSSSISRVLVDHGKLKEALGDHSNLKVCVCVRVCVLVPGPQYKV